MQLGYFIIGLFVGIILNETTKDDPFKPVTFHDGKALSTRIYYYRYNPYQYNEIYPYGYYRYQPNSYSQGNNSGSRTNTNTGGGNTRSAESGESHGRTVEVNDRKKNWIKSLEIYMRGF